MKQTAVEWLVEQLVKMDKQLDGRRKNGDATVLKLNPTKVFEQAKEMEKDAIAEAYIAGREYGCKHDDPETGEEYYDKTYRQ